MTIDFAIPRAACTDCGAVRRLVIGFADPRRSDTRAFERHALQPSRLMAIEDVGRNLFG